MTPERRPSNKVTAGAVGGALSILVAWVIGLTGTDVPAEVAIAFSTVFSFGLGYWVTDDTEPGPFDG